MATLTELLYPNKKQETNPFSGGAKLRIGIIGTGGKTGSEHTINLYGGTFESSATKRTVYLSWAATLNVDGATVKSAKSSAIYMGGSATVNICCTGWCVQGRSGTAGDGGTAASVENSADTGLVLASSTRCWSSAYHKGT